MPSEKAVDTVNNFSEEAWRRYYYARHACAIQRFTDVDEADAKSITKNLLDEHLLLHRMEADTAFNRMIRRKLAQLEWVESHILELGTLAVLDMLHPGQPTMKDTDELSSRIDSTMTRRNLQRLMREYYPELFIFLDDDANIDDGRATPFRTIFTAVNLTDNDEDIRPLAQSIMEYEDSAIRGLVKEKFSRVIKLNLAIRLVDPDETCGLIKFQERVGRSAGIIKGWWKEAEEDTNWTIKQLNHHGVMPDQLYQMIFRVVLLRWYSEKSLIERKKLLNKRYRLIYTANDAAKVISCNRKWFSKLCDVYSIMVDGADAYVKLEENQVALTILESCLNIPDLDDFDRGWCHHGMADCFRGLNKLGEMLKHLNAARVIWEKMNSHYDLAINWSATAQAYHLKDKREEFQAAWRRSKDLIKFDLSPNQQARVMLYAADDAAQVKDRAWEREALEIGCECSSYMEKPDLFLYLNQRLNDLNAGKTTWIAELGPGKLKHPEEHPAHRPKGEYYIPILPSQIGGELEKRPKINREQNLADIDH